MCHSYRSFFQRKCIYPLLLAAVAFSNISRAADVISLGIFNTGDAVVDAVNAIPCDSVGGGGSFIVFEGEDYWRYSRSCNASSDTGKSYSVQGITPYPNGGCPNNQLPLENGKCEDPPGGPPHCSSGSASAPAGDANPIGFSAGNKFQSESDYRHSANPLLHFVRYYNSINNGWTHSFSQRINIESIGQFYFRATAYRDNGKVVKFSYSNSNGGSLKPWVSITDELIPVYSGDALDHWEYRQRNNITEFYDTTGQLYRISDRYGHVLTVIHNGDTTTVTNQQDGAQLVITTNVNGLLSTFQDPFANNYNYTFDASNNLTQVVGPTGTRQYHYEDVSFANALTGITDENGIRYATWAYDSEGRAISSEHAGGAEHVDFSFNVDGTLTTTNPLGKQTTYYFQTIGGVRKVVHVEGHATESCLAANQDYQYNINGFVDQKIDWQGNTTIYQRDTGGRETSRTEASGTSEARTILTEWNASLNVRTKITEPERETNFTYDSEGRVLTRTVSELGANPKTQTWTYTYHPAFGKVATVDGPRTDVSDVVFYNYDVNGNISKVTNEAGHVTSYTAYDARGNVLSLTDANGVIIDLSYHPLGWLTESIVRAPVGSGGADQTTTYNYDNIGQLTSMTFPSGNTIAYEYDGARRLTAIEDAEGNRQEYTLDAAGNRLSEVIKDSNGVVVKTMTQTFDELNRLRDMVGAVSQTRHFDYDVNDNNTADTNPRNFTTNKEYDALNRLIKSIDPLLGETDFVYDDRDNLTNVTDATGLSTAYEYNAFDNLTRLVSPDTGTTDFTYDSANNRTAMIDARGIIAQYTYDALNRITSVIYPNNPSENITYSYDDNAADNFGIGRVTQITDASGQLNYRYDFLGNLVSKTYAIDNQTFSLQYSYDNANRLTQITYPSGRLVNYIYNTLNQITSVTTQEDASAMPQTVADNVAYLPFGPSVGWRYGNDLIQEHSFDQDYRLTRQQLYDQTTLADYDYGFDANSNIIDITNLLNLPDSKDFDYDALDRLNQSQHNGTDIDFTYDAIGNRLTRTITQGTSTITEAYTYDIDSHQLTQVSTDDNGSVTTRQFSYDSNGNLISDIDNTNSNTSTYTYGDRNRPTNTQTSIEQLTYLHNSLGQRTQKHNVTTNQTERYHYNEAGQLLAVSNNNGAYLQEWIYLGNQTLAALIETDTTNTAPVVTIQTPANNSQFPIGGEITFAATAQDINQGDISSQIVWHSNLDGNLGAGASISTDALSTGAHVVTAKATNNANLTGSGGILVTVVGDFDDDGLPDEWELMHFGDLSQGSDDDFDGDGITNGQEFFLGTEPTVANSDTDSDGLPDSWELNYFGNLSPMSEEDVDSDGLSNFQEYMLSTNPLDQSSTATLSNVALNQPASQSSTYETYVADIAVDGDTGIAFTHTLNELNAWWEVDLQTISYIAGIELFNRIDCCSSRLFNVYIFVSDTAFQSTNLGDTLNQAGVSAYFYPGVVPASHLMNIQRTGRYVRIQLSGTSVLSLREVVVNAYDPEDIDEDGLPDAWELQYFDNLSKDGEDDDDQDGAPNLWEYLAGQNPVDPSDGDLDSDVDGLIDSWEFNYFGDLSPIPEDDVDGDGLTNLQEYTLGTNPLDQSSTAALSNVALNQPATQSSTYEAYVAGIAVDGDTGIAFTHTLNELNAWWEVDLQTISYIAGIALFNRIDCCSSRLSDIYVLVSDTAFQSTDLNATLNQAGVSAYFYAGEVPASHLMNIQRTGRYVRIQLSGTSVLSLREVIVNAYDPEDIDGDGLPDN